LASSAASAAAPRIDPDIKKFFNAAIKSMTTPGRHERMNKLTISDGWRGVAGFGKFSTNRRAPLTLSAPRTPATLTSARAEVKIVAGMRVFSYL
jgi:hypothetical protein